MASTTHRLGPTRRLLAVAAATVLLATACSQDSEPEVAGDLQVADGALGSEAGPEDDDDRGELQAIDLAEFLARRYEAYWEAFDEARQTPSADPSTDFPLLGELAAGEQLEVSYRTLIELAETGEAIREPETPAVDGVDADTEHRVRVDLIDGTVAELSGCVVNDDVHHVIDSGVVVRDSVSTVMSESTMALTEGEWKLIRSRAVDIDPGVTGCWLTDDAEFPY
ncbi:MAG: hypothetical protein OEV40_00200 [Acidimicrobiia bacterium]|nr:hypothetical protein [Acidimicrobiia bacterium]